MKLIERYATACDVNIGSQFLLEHFYPLPFARYITLHPSSGMPAKNYPYYQEVIALSLAALNKADIKIVQLGDKNDPLLQGCIDLRGKTTKHQSGFVLRGSMLHLGNDSWLAHRAGEIGTPLITLFGSTTAANHSAYRYDPAKTVFIESHRSGCHASFAPQENPQSISFIPPEKVTNAVFDLLKLDVPRLTFESRLFGLVYNHAIFELVPNSFPPPTFLPEAPMVVRMDYLFNEDVLLNLLKTGRKVNIITNKPINLNILAPFRQSIMTYSHEIDKECPIQYVANLGGIIQNKSFYTKEQDEAKLAELRFHFFDMCNIQMVKDIGREDYLDSALHYLNWPSEKRVDLSAELSDNSGKLMFKSNKYLLSEGAMFTSRAHWKANRPIANPSENSGTAIDSPDFWVDLNHFTIYHQP